MNKNDPGNKYIQSTRSEKHEWNLYVNRYSNGVNVVAVEGENDGHFFSVAYGNGPGSSRQERIVLPHVKRITEKARNEAFATMEKLLKEKGYIA